MMQRSINFDEDSKSLFEQLKFDKTQTTIDKSTLQALLLYCDVDKIDPFFFNSLNKKIEGIPRDQLTYNEFVQVFDFSRDPFPRMTVEELAQLFTMFDPTNKGEITANDFLKIYQETPEGRSGQNEIDHILRDFELLDPVRKSISPEEFLKILNVQNQPGFQQQGLPQSPYRGQQGGVYQSQNIGGNVNPIGGYPVSPYDNANYAGSPERINVNQGYNQSPNRSQFQQGGLPQTQSQQSPGRSQYGANQPR